MDLKESEISSGKYVGRHPWEVARKKVVLSLLRKYVPALFEKKSGVKSVLDMGCGDTWLVEQLAQKTISTNYLAVDIAFDNRQLQQYREKLKLLPIRVFNNIENAVKDTSVPSQAVLLLDVIEHIQDDIGFLKWLCTYEIISKDTIFIITVPAFQSLWSRHDIFLGHYRRYNNRMLRHHVNRAGLEVISIGYFFTSLLPARLMQVLKEKISGEKENVKGVGGWKPRKAVDRILTGILIFDYYLSRILRFFGIKLPGLSNYVICKMSA